MKSTPCVSSSENRPTFAPFAQLFHNFFLAKQLGGQQTAKRPIFRHLWVNFMPQIANKKWANGKKVGQILKDTDPFRLSKNKCKNIFPMNVIGHVASRGCNNKKIINNETSDNVVKIKVNLKQVNIKEQKNLV